MLGILMTVGGFALKFAGRTIGTHLFSKELGGLSLGAAQFVIEGLGFRGILGLVLGLYATHKGFRDGIKSALFSLF